MEKKDNDKWVFVLFQRHLRIEQCNCRGKDLLEKYRQDIKNSFKVIFPMLRIFIEFVLIYVLFTLIA
jgi:hypothetical protein